MILYNKLTPIIYLHVADSGVVLTMRFLCNVRGRRKISNDIWEDILREFAQNDDIDFAYPTQRIYYNAIEGKTDAKATKGTDFAVRVNNGQ